MFPARHRETPPCLTPQVPRLICGFRHLKISCRAKAAGHSAATAAKATNTAASSKPVKADPQQQRLLPAQALELNLTDSSCRQHCSHSLLKPLKRDSFSTDNRSTVASTDSPVHSVAQPEHQPQTVSSPAVEPTASAPVPQQYVPGSTAQTTLSLLVIEVFAGSYSAGRLTGRLNNSSSNLGITISAYAAVELTREWRPPSPESLGLTDPSRCLLVTGSVTDPVVHGRLRQFIQSALHQSANGTGPRVDGVMLFGGPPCTNYSTLQLLNMQKIIKPDPYKFLRKQYASDRLVLAFLGLYNSIKGICASPEALHPVTKRPVPGCILMENPKSPLTVNIPYSDKEIQASHGALNPDSIKLTTQLNLGGRHFMQPYLVRSVVQTKSNRVWQRGRPKRQQTGISSDTGSRNSNITSTNTSTSTSDSSLEEDAGSSSSSSDSSTAAAAAVLQYRKPQLLQPQPKLLGGFLHVTTHAWCSYASLTHPMKNTYIFSDLESLQDTKCICGHCRPKGESSWAGVNHTQKLFVRHLTDVEGLQGGDGGHRATWPDAWLTRVAWLFSLKVLKQQQAAQQQQLASQHEQEQQQQQQEEEEQQQQQQ